MKTKLFILTLLLLAISCGKEVKIDNKKLERSTMIDNPDSLVVEQEGTIVKGTEDKLKVGDKEYVVSKYSSHQALTFISNLAAGSETTVKFRGELKESEALLQTLE